MIRWELKFGRSVDKDLHKMDKNGVLMKRPNYRSMSRVVCFTSFVCLVNNQMNKR